MCRCSRGTSSSWTRASSRLVRGGRLSRWAGACTPLVGHHVGCRPASPQRHRGTEGSQRHLDRQSRLRGRDLDRQGFVSSSQGARCSHCFISEMCQCEHLAPERSRSERRGGRAPDGPPGASATEARAGPAHGWNRHGVVEAQHDAPSPPRPRAQGPRPTTDAYREVRTSSGGGPPEPRAAGHRSPLPGDQHEATEVSGVQAPARQYTPPRDQCPAATGASPSPSSSLCIHFVRKGLRPNMTTLLTMAVTAMMPKTSP